MWAVIEFEPVWISSSYSGLENINIVIRSALWITAQTGPQWTQVQCEQNGVTDKPGGLRWVYLCVVCSAQVSSCCLCPAVCMPGWVSWPGRGPLEDLEDSGPQEECRQEEGRWTTWSVWGARPWDSRLRPSPDWSVHKTNTHTTHKDDFIFIYIKSRVKIPL